MYHTHTLITHYIFLNSYAFFFRFFSASTAKKLLEETSLFEKADIFKNIH